MNGLHRQRMIVMWCVCVCVCFTLFAVRGQLFGRAKVCYLNVHLFTEQNILWFQISVTKPQ